MERPQNKHLRPWKPGQSGNPKGKPKRSLTTLLREAGEKGEVLGERLPEGMTVAEAFAQAAWGHAIKGNPSFASQILDRLEGKVPQPEPITKTPAQVTADAVRSARDRAAARRERVNATDG